MVLHSTPAVVKDGIGPSGWRVCEQMTTFHSISQREILRTLQLAKKQQRRLCMQKQPIYKCPCELFYDLANNQFDKSGANAKS